MSCCFEKTCYSYTESKCTDQFSTACDKRIMVKLADAGVPLQRYFKEYQTMAWKLGLEDCD